jgi:transcriptional regulator of acetoin/glycerol metabolism
VTLRERLEQCEREAIIETLRCHIGIGRMTRAAKSLGIARKTLWDKMRRLGIDKRLETPQERLAI